MFSHPSALHALLHKLDFVTLVWVLGQALPPCHGPLMHFPHNRPTMHPPPIFSHTSIPALPIEALVPCSSEAVPFTPPPCSYEEDVRVPFFMRGPGVPRGVKSDWQASMVDLPATIIKLAGRSVG